MAQQRLVPGKPPSESTESEYRGDMSLLEHSLATQNIDPALPERSPLSDNNAAISETAPSPGLPSTSMARMGLSRRGDNFSPRAPLTAEPSLDSFSSIDPLLSPPLAGSRRSAGTAGWSDPISSPFSTQVGSHTRGSGGYFEQVKVEQDDLGNSRSDISMSSPYIGHSDHGSLHRLAPMSSFEPSGMIFFTLVL